MAPSFSRKNKTLLCFYCNKKSGTKYDGLITRWDCPQCESTNFLDENGEITDPPAATEPPAPRLVRYTTAPAKSQVPTDDSELFCATCVKNQHLYTASLAQYHVETDPNHPQYKEMEREYFTYRKSLERLYPQVCEDCEPKVLARLRDAGRTAKADHLRRAMDKSRARRLNRDPKFSFSGTIGLFGKCLWYIGLVGQIGWSMLLLSLTSIRYNWPGFTPDVVFGESSDGLQSANSLARVCLVCSIASIWWNPMFKQMNKGFVSHISGFGDWYKLQSISILVRLIFHNTVASGSLTDTLSPATIGANGFIVVFTCMLAVMSHRSLKVDMTPLWAATPEKLSHVGPKTSNSPQGIESMADLLEQMGATPSRSSKNRMSSSPSNASTFKLHVAKKANYEDNFSSSLTPQRKTLDQVRSSPSYSNMSSGLQQQQHSYGVEEMEWTPTETQSQHRAFNYPQSSQRTSESFGRAPMVEQPSPFWYKVPPAPITPAQKLRNPPNQPALRVSSQEVKENFFNRVTHRRPASDTHIEQSPFTKKDNTRHEVEFAQQKFFLPPPPSEAGNSLADLLTGFSLGGSEVETPEQLIESRPWKSRLIQILILFLGVTMWKHAAYNPSEHSQKFMVAVLLACIGVGLRNVFEYTTLSSAKHNSPIHNLGTVISGLESAGALYLLIEILAGRGCASHGTLLTGGMLIHRLLVALIGA